MTKLPKGLKHPRSFRQFAWLADQDSDVSFPNDEDLLNAMYEQLKGVGGTKSDWLRRGDEVIAFLEHALEGTYSDKDLANMWFASGAQTYFKPEDIRAVLTFMLERVRVFQEQNRAGTFVPYERPF